MNHPDTGQPPAVPHGFAPQGPDAYRTPGAQPAQHPYAAPAHGGAPGTPPQPPRKSWFARHKILTAILAIVVLIVLANAFGGGDDEPGSAAPAATTGTDAVGDGAAPADQAAADAADAEQVEPEPADEAGPGMGDAVRDGKFEFTVTDVEAGVAEVGNEWLNEQAQGQFVLVHVTVANIGDQAQMFHGDNHTLVDDQGREHSANSAAAIYLEDSDSFLTDINPGNTVEAVVVFDIPADAVPAAVELHDSMFSGGVTVSLSD
ncbi:DUF4352 domain-containing protein [Georgenia sp. MJ170]|uniref:DUF4352 domain-containing protein n=1 Tax=Georgenia sunbinii TaxID=3117728 RepID=UPI002F269C45